MAAKASPSAGARPPRRPPRRPAPRRRETSGHKRASDEAAVFDAAAPPPSKRRRRGDVRADAATSPRRSARLQKPQHQEQKEPRRFEASSLTRPDVRTPHSTRGAAARTLQKPTAEHRAQESSPPPPPPPPPEPRLRRAPLTKENLKTLRRTMAGQSRSGAGTASTSRSSRRSSSGDGGIRMSKTLSTTSSGFDARAAENGILGRKDSRPPRNLADERERLNRARATASPTESVWNDYVEAIEDAPNEATMLYETLPLMKDYGRRDVAATATATATRHDTGYRKTLNQAFTAFPGDAGFNRGLSAPQPDMVEGLKRDRFAPFPVEDELGGAAVLVQDAPNPVTLPHLAGEWKGPGKNMLKARTQSAYDGAALVYARNQALAYMGTADAPGHAAVTTLTTDGTSLNFYAHYATPADDEPRARGKGKAREAEADTKAKTRTKTTRTARTMAGKPPPTTLYHQYPLATTNMTLSLEDFKKGRRQLRNAQDMARERSYDLRDRLVEHWEAQPEEEDEQGEKYEKYENAAWGASGTRYHGDDRRSASYAASGDGDWGKRAFATSRPVPDEDSYVFIDGDADAGAEYLTPAFSPRPSRLSRQPKPSRSSRTHGTRK